MAADDMDGAEDPFLIEMQDLLAPMTDRFRACPPPTSFVRRKSARCRKTSPPRFERTATAVRCAAWSHAISPKSPSRS